MRRFAVVWLGQAFSLLGTNVSAFGVTVWAYKETGSATAMALIPFFLVTPMLIVSPLAGALVDRLNRKFMMMVSDLASGLTSTILLVLFLADRLEIWHIYLGGVFIGTFMSFQWPAYSAAMTTIVPKDQLGRANGMVMLAETGTNILGPMLGATLLGFIGLGGILIADLITMLLAILTLLIVPIPRPQITQIGLESRSSLWKESLYGFTYILKRPGLLGLQAVFFVGNFFSTISFTLMPPMILARTANNELILGAVSSIGAIGGVVGGALMSTWGGTKRKVHGVLSGWGLSGVFGVLMGLSKTAPGWTAARFLGVLTIPFIDASNQAIWQSKVAPDVQGRVFSIRRLIAWFSTPLATLAAGPLADYLVEPAMQAGGNLAPVFGSLVGVGPGAGMALIIVFAELAVTLIGFGAYSVRIVRDVEVLMPDDEPASGIDAEPVFPG